MKQKKENKFSWLINALVILIFFIALILIFHIPIRNRLIASGSNQYQLNNISKRQIEQNKKEKSNFDSSQVKSATFQSVLSNIFNTSPLPVIGEIAIPALKINLPIFKGIENRSLLYGTGTLKENDSMGQRNYSLVAHNMSAARSNLSILFTPLKKAKSGMFIYITDKNYIYQYQIDKTTTLKSEYTDVTSDIPGKSEITLITSEDIGSTDFTIVQGTYMSKTPFNKMTLEMKDAFSKKY